MRVLVADDSKSLRMMISKTVLDAGHEVIEAVDGNEAVCRFTEEEIDLVVMDAEMPNLDGFAATAGIREVDRSYWAPVIFLSGHTEDDYIQRALDLGADVYLRKPLNSVELIGQIKAMERISEMQKELRAMNEVLEGLAHKDGLTQLYNRRSFDERLDVELARCYRNQLGVSLLLGDIDCFKLYNDTYGHQAGDTCLQKVAEVIKGSFNRATDMAARYGGEEFVIILPETGEEVAGKMAAMMLEKIEALGIEHKASLAKDVVTMSLGTAYYGGEGPPNAKELIEAADKALYQAKESGRARVVQSFDLH